MPKAMSQDSAAAECVAQMHRFVIEVQQNGNYDLVDEIIHPDFVDHTAQPGQPAGRAGAYATLKHIHAVVENIKMTIVHCISDGKVVATTKIMRGTQIGDVLERAATGKGIEFIIMDFVTVVDGKFREHWATLGPIKDL